MCGQNGPEIPPTRSSVIRTTVWPPVAAVPLPSFHSSLMADFVANRANGRFQYDDKTGQGKPQEKHWDVIKDMHPENGDQMMGDVIGIGWRPHKA